MLNKLFKGGKINIHIGDNFLKHLNTEAVGMSVEGEWDVATKIMITQE